METKISRGSYRRKAYKDLSFTDDFMFRKVLCSNEELCKRLIELLLDVKVDHICYKDGEHSITANTDSKSVRLDVYLADEEGTVFDLEMQNLRQFNLSRRTRYYQSMIDIDHLSAGDPYNKLPDSYIVFICMFDPYRQGLHKYEFKELCLQNTDIELGSGTNKVFINAKCKNDIMSDEMKAFLGFLCGEEASSDLTKEIADNVERAKAFRSWEAEYMQLQDMISLAEQDARIEGREEGLAEGHAEGLAEGLAEGRAEGEAEIVRMNSYLLAQGRIEDLRRATEDEAFRRSILEEMGRF